MLNIIKHNKKWICFKFLHNFFNFRMDIVLYSIKMAITGKRLAKSLT